MSHRMPPDRGRCRPGVRSALWPIVFLLVSLVTFQAQAGAARLASAGKGVSVVSTDPDCYLQGCWTLMQPAQPQGWLAHLDDISCASSEFCAAVGTQYTSGVATLAEMWDGAEWDLAPTSDPAGS